MRRGKLAGAVLLAGWLVLPAAAWAADGDGVIVEVDGKARAFTVAVRERGRSVLETFRTDDRTRITFGRKEVPFGNLVPGGHVSVRYKDNESGAVATAVTIHRLKRR